MEAQPRENVEEATTGLQYEEGEILKSPKTFRFMLAVFAGVVLIFCAIRSFQQTRFGVTAWAYTAMR